MSVQESTESILDAARRTEIDEIEQRAQRFQSSLYTVARRVTPYEGGVVLTHADFDRLLHWARRPRQP